MIWWISFLAGILAAMAGYFLGKRKGERTKNSEDFSVHATSPVVLEPDVNYEEIAKKDKAFIQKYEMVTVLFADIEGFSAITDSLELETLLNDLNSFFFYFDTVVERYHIEKIKTMGDAYMCAGGIPQKNNTNPVDVTMVALDVQNHLNKMGEHNPNVWSVRIGIHTGQVVAGMLGHKKLSFDIWGHTVNVAARMESSCKAGKVNISGTTYEKIKSYFDCEYQGKSPLTNVISYYVKGLKPEYIELNANGHPVPNHAFFIQMQLLRLTDLEEYVEKLMTDDRVSNLYYHNFRHTWDVYEQVKLLANLENMNDDAMMLMRTAALLHDIGYSISYGDDINTLSEDFARETLPTYQYKPQQIDCICQLMRATHYESVPNSIMEEVMHDANLMYFGQADYITRMMGLAREQEKHHIPVNKTVWLQEQINRLNNHRFYTQSAKSQASTEHQAH